MKTFGEKDSQVLAIRELKKTDSFSLSVCACSIKGAQFLLVSPQENYAVIKLQWASLIKMCHSDSHRGT